MTPISMQTNADQNVRATAYASQSTANTDDGSATITAANFMTLLVTEMKNQDPTQPTDPTAYMQQLVGVNSLQQLITMNKQLTSLGGSTNGSTTTPSTTGV